jgi:hypothetical protein
VDEYSEFIKKLDIPLLDNSTITDYDDVAYKAMLEDEKREIISKKNAEYQTLKLC